MRSLLERAAELQETVLTLERENTANHEGTKRPDRLLLAAKIQGTVPPRVKGSPNLVRERVLP